MSNSASNPVGRVSLKDIAAYAKVSTGSVSSVLKNLHVERRIPQATADKIRKAAATLGYLPNINARSLRNGSTTNSPMILALITSFEAPIPLINHFVASLRQETSKRGGQPAFALMIEMFSAGELEKLPGILSGDRFNAALILNTITKDDQFLADNFLPYPVILVNRSIAGYPSVVEPADTGTRAAEVLGSSKRRRLAVLHGVPLTQTTQNRVASFMRQTEEMFGCPASEIIAHSLSEEAGYEAMKGYLAAGRRCDGLYTVSDALALGAYKAIKEERLTIPGDISVLGVGDYNITSFFDPSLSWVGVSHAEMAYQTTRLLLERLQTREIEATHVSLPIQEVLQASTG